MCIRDSFIDEGIDTGRRIVHIEKISVSHFKDITSAKNYLFSLDAKMFKKAIIRLLQDKSVSIENVITQGKRYYVMSNLFRNVVENILREEVTGTSG